MKYLSICLLLLTGCVQRTVENTDIVLAKCVCKNYGISLKLLRRADNVLTIYCSENSILISRNDYVNPDNCGAK
jgi:hypothetical protein